MKLKIITKFKEVKQLVKHCKRTGYASIDYETTGFKYYDINEYPLILGVSFQPGSAWIIPLGHKDSPFKHKYEKILYYFGRKVLENWDIVKVAWNAKFEYKWTTRFNITIKGRYFDAMLAKYCLDEERPHGLKEFVNNFFPQWAGYEKKIKVVNDKGETDEVDWKNTNFGVLCEYCGHDCDLTLQGMIYMEPKLIKNKFYNLFRNLLMGMVRVFSDGEYSGLLVDKPYLEELIRIYEVKINTADKKMRNTPSLVKYEVIHKRRHLRALMKGVKLDIRRIKKEAPPNAAVLIANRRKKITGFLEGKFGKKELYEPLNLNSPAQLANFFFLKDYGLQLPIIKYTKDKKTKQSSENPSTAEDVLEVLKKKDKSGFMKNLLDYRTITKLHSTYMVGPREKMDEHNRIHAQFQIHGTVTGRTSCVNPNLQNIPRGSTSADIKRMFIPPPGYLLFEVDYSQAELRVVAEIAGDETMINIFKRNYNPHVATACLIEGTKNIDQYEKVKSTLKTAEAMDAKELALPKNAELLKWVKAKKRGKSLNFSILYGQGDEAMAEELECSPRQAGKFKNEWLNQYPKIKRWIKNQHKYARDHGYVYNLFGRKRRLHDIDSHIKYFRAEAERQAVNAPIQGASGDFTLFSQVVIREEVLKGNLPRDFEHKYCVHDSIGYYIQPKHIHTVVPKVMKICENPETLRYFGFEMKDVRMKVAGEIGTHWAALKDYDAWTNYEDLLINQ